MTATALRAAVEDALESAHASRWQVTRSERDALELVEHICRRFPRYVWQLSERHAGRSALVIDDEYDVQDHLHALLRLHFDDVREEEWAPSYGGSRTRMDFLLKRERMVVETKMTRDRLDQAKVVDELVIARRTIASTLTARRWSASSTIPTTGWPNPDALESDVSGNENGLTTRVIVAPQPSS